MYLRAFKKRTAPSFNSMQIFWRRRLPASFPHRKSSEERTRAPIAGWPEGTFAVEPVNPLEWHAQDPHLIPRWQRSSWIRGHLRFMPCVLGDTAETQPDTGKPAKAWPSRQSPCAIHATSLQCAALMRGGAVWQLVGLITRRSQVQILPPLPGFLRRATSVALLQGKRRKREHRCLGSKTTVNYGMGLAPIFFWRDLQRSGRSQ